MYSLTAIGGCGDSFLQPHTSKIRAATVRERMGVNVE